MLSLPSPAADRLKLADWLESLAIVSADANASFVDLERALRRERIPGSDTDEGVELLVQEVANEIDLRATAANSAYPFDVHQRGIALRGPIGDYVPYIFCLKVSTLNTDRALDTKPYPRRMFERLSCVAARNYVCGEVVRFGSPRDKKELPPEFVKAIDMLCARIGEGGGFRQKHAHSRKDDAVDVVAWRDFPDRMEGKLVLMGNCASGQDWASKLNDMVPQQFCEDWMREVPVSIRSCLKAFFVPRRLEASEWSFVSRRAGIVFDRCRIAWYVPSGNDFEGREDLLNWAKTILTSESK